MGNHVSHDDEGAEENALDEKVVCQEERRNKEHDN
jgi:hypothetical protein